MTVNRQGVRAVRVGAANRAREVAEPFLRKHCPRLRASRQDGHSPTPEWGGHGAPLLACAVPLAFCSGLLQLVVLPAHGVVVPRWLILAHGAGCVLLAVLALLLSRPWRQRQPSGSERTLPGGTVMQGSGYHAKDSPDGFERERLALLTQFADAIPWRGSSR
jgi:hypothetical protein